jgi:Domain of unknown function (DUF4265)
MTNKKEFATHLEPAWRERANFIINAPLEETNRFEQLWARQVDESEFEVCCIPFFLYDVALGDLVETHISNGLKNAVCRVGRPSGRYVFRVHFGQDQYQFRKSVPDGLVALGALLEWSSASLVGVDARDQAHAQIVADFLQSREDLGHLVYETGKTV